MITIRLPFETVPLRSNDRLHWRARAAVTKDIRIATRIIGQNMRIEGCPIDYPVTVTLVWEVTDRRVRDVGAIAPTGKAAIDGLVAGGVLAGDGHRIVVEERYRIEVGSVRGVRIEIRAVSDQDDSQATRATSTGEPPAHRQAVSAQPPMEGK